MLIKAGPRGGLGGAQRGAEVGAACEGLVVVHRDSSEMKKPPGRTVGAGGGLAMAGV